jgi:nitrite reductase/ring-hydroxylating ferredoxin subunit
LAAIRFDNQAQFHPTKYVAGLARTIPGDGCHVFENSRVTDWTPTTVKTEAGNVSARFVIMATHLPLGQIGGFYAEAHPQAEPVIAAKIQRVPEGMFVSAEKPSRSIRTHTNEDGSVYAIAAGNGFKPGHTDEERRAFAEIESWLTENFNAGPIEYRWVNEDYTSMDNAPFIGWSSSFGDRYLVATGFGAWGISNGTAAAIMLTDLVHDRESPWTPIFKATRVKPIAGGPRFIKENLSVAGHLVGGFLSRKPDTPDDLEPGEAAVLKIDGDNIAAFRDEDGHLHKVSAVCSHMGCLVGWNEVERTWDCACHGSRFELDGQVIHGPATQPLGSKITG